MNTQEDDTATGGPDVTADASARFPDIAALSYEQARDELVEIVARLEGGRLGLEESMTLWQRGEALAARCSSWLERAEESLSASRPDGNPPPG